MSKRAKGRINELRDRNVSGASPKQRIGELNEAKAKLYKDGYTCSSSLKMHWAKVRTFHAFNATPPNDQIASCTAGPSTIIIGAPREQRSTRLSIP
ncbi:hypothetical protein SAMN04488032_1144 [Pacificibacter marinus]|uniref:Uncharacterized protein n=1 Tax=Pacificibacter marinus TaxID=658057 RepID=A0A1Y5T7B7_9RHOB|nr:hypothetical protein SAMN04488032_1144 [Pacificibacter marinus]SLN55631.1 hypothetical protein PAM7971_02866 [Pacificibacter marinus]